MCDYCNGLKRFLINQRLDAGIFGRRNINVYIESDKGNGEMWLIMRNQRNSEDNEEISFERIFFCPMCGRKLDPPYSEFNHVNYEKLSQCINEIEDKRADLTDAKNNSVAEGIQIALDIISKTFLEEYKRELKI